MLAAQWGRFYEVKSETLRVVNMKTLDLLRTYTWLLDIIGELWFGKFRVLFKAYSICNQFVGEIKAYLDKDLFA